MLRLLGILQPAEKTQIKNLYQFLLKRQEKIPVLGHVIFMTEKGHS